MVLLNAENIAKNWGEYQMFDHVQFALEEQDKVGFIGINGTGKSTFLRILAGLEEADEGTVTYANGTRIGYLPQAPDFSEDITVLEQVFRGADSEFAEERAYEAKTLLTQLDVTEFDKSVRLLSGGQKKRVAIVSALLNPSEILILDEPTNHIDNETAAWLEKQLRAYRGAVVMITHDRYFLDRVANRICELDHGHLHFYNENYSGYLMRKAEREMSEAAAERKRQTLLKRELAWIQRGARARGTKSRDRIERFEALKAQSGPVEAPEMELASIATRLGKKIIDVNAISKSWDGITYLDDLSMKVARDDRIGIVGRNGTGKSTFLRLLAGQIVPDSGRIELGETVKIGYFSQDCSHMNPEQKVIDFVRDIAETVQTPDGMLSAAQVLEKFLFTGEMQWTRIGDLSGGEQRRLYLLSVIIDAPNILLLDEPTNDLDIETLNILENYVMVFEGAVIAVSHDRYFLDKIANRTFEFRKGGEVRQYLGNYADYEAKREESVADLSVAAKPKEKKKTTASARKMSYKEQYELEHIEEELDKLEQQIAKIDAELPKAATDFVRLQELTEKKDALEQKLYERTERWIELQDLAESLNKQE